MKPVTATKPPPPMRAMLMALTAKHIKAPPELKENADRATYRRTILLEGFVPALGYAPLATRKDIDRALCHALLDVFTAMDDGLCEWTGSGFVDVDGQPWEGGGDGAF